MPRLIMREHVSDSIMSTVNFAHLPNSRSQRIGFFAACAVAFLVILTVLSNSFLGPWDSHRPWATGISDPDTTTFTHGEEEILVNQYLKHIARPPRGFEVNTSHYAPHGWEGWDLPGGKTRHWTKPLGKDLCIFDFDNRAFNESGMIWSNETMTWRNPNLVHGLSLGILNHWLYAKIHGYKYYYIDVLPFPDRRASWKKPFLIPALLAHHSTCVFMDSDAIFPQISLPFEWIMNYWALDPAVDSVAMAIDPDKPYNRDRLGKLYLNTGFIIAHAQPTTFKLMDAWRTCPDEGSPYPECVEFKQPMFNLTDQGGFGTFIRYDFKENVRELPCKEANGFAKSETECRGELVSHLWTGKDTWIKDRVGEQIPGDLLEALHGMFRREMESFRFGEEEILAEKRKGRKWWV